MDKAVISGTYSDFKIIRSRKVAQIIIEVPIVGDQALITALGLPNPAEEVWVAVARLQATTLAKKPEPAPAASPGSFEAIREKALKEIGAKPSRPFSSLPYPQQAALRCQDVSFRNFLRHKGWLDGMDGAEEAAQVVRNLCEVGSRSDIRPGTKAEKLWLRLNTEYTFWESARAA
jgi:hypothetical protein